MRLARSLLIAAQLSLALLPAGVAYADIANVQGSQGENYQVRVVSLKQARFKTTIQQQYDFSCGSAAVATLLTYQYGYKINEETVFQEMYQSGDQAKIRREGFSLLDMKRFLESRGFMADGYELPLSKLEETQIPAIVLVIENGYHHFVVVKGVRGSRVLIGDPATGTRAISREHFNAIWDSQLLFVIHNHEEAARFNLAADWRVAPSGPLEMGVNRDSLFFTVMPKHGPGDF
ncbi:peptidase C39 [Cupriavidus sp. USMAA2-4]|uniref:C39 family peptidase n=1 Tax=unclassified Cupriavidus TaxID=2640874 RepID=UPI0008A6E8F8|nr:MULTISPECIES: C39 family peptidase [unclassified Cupriavidus]AOY95164.1 peptidase C39 [Cupriavidus sp. USMAA2-4]AOZ01937.1 peptidase C39 [Cupriavidus sp. USMAHM13]